MGLTLIPAATPGVDVAAIEARIDNVAATSRDEFENVRGMVLRRDPRLTSLEDVASRFATEIARTDQVHADLQAGIDQALARTMIAGKDGTNGKDGAAGQAGKDGAAGTPGTANLAIGARPVGALVLGGSTTITLPLSRTMPTTDYRVEFAHSAVIGLANVTYSNIVKTTTTVSVKVTSVGLALVAGTLIAVAW